MLTSNDLVELSKVEIEDINPKTLKELTEIYINPNMSIEERIDLFFNQIENPYCFLINGTPVQISYNNHNKTLDECLYNYFVDKRNSNNAIL